MTAKKDNTLAWGVTLLVFGCLFLVRTMNVFTPEIANYIFDIKNYPLLIGVIFLFAHSNKNIGIILIVVGLLLRLSDIINWTRHISDFIWPLLLIIAGGVMVFKRK